MSSTKERENLFNELGGFSQAQVQALIDAERLKFVRVVDLFNEMFPLEEDVVHVKVIGDTPDTKTAVVTTKKDEWVTTHRFKIIPSGEFKQHQSVYQEAKND